MNLKNEEDDFVKDETVKLEIDGRTFEYKPTTGGEEIDWLNEYMVTTYDEDKKKEVTTRDFAILNKLKLKNITGAPYSKETINKMTGIDKEFKDMTADQRLIVLGRLKGATLNKIIDAMTKYDSGNTPLKKN